MKRDQHGYIQPPPLRGHEDIYEVEPPVGTVVPGVQPHPMGPWDGAARLSWQTRWLQQRHQHNYFDPALLPGFDGRSSALPRVGSGYGMATSSALRWAWGHKLVSVAVVVVGLIVLAPLFGEQIGKRMVGFALVFGAVSIMLLVTVARMRFLARNHRNLS